MIEREHRTNQLRKHILVGNQNGPSRHFVKDGNLKDGNRTFPDD